MQSRKYFLIIIFLIILLSTLLVFNNPYKSKDIPQSIQSTGIGDIDIDDLTEQIVRSTKSVERYFQDTETVYEYSGTKAGIPEKKSINAVMTAKADNAERLLWASINSTFEEGGLPVEIGIEMYSTADSLYIDMHTDGESPGWIQTFQVADSWDKLVSFDNVLTVLENEAVRSLRSDVDKGVDCWVMEIPVRDIYIIYAILKNSYGLENQFRYSYELIQAFSKNFVIEIWVDRDSSLIIKIIISMDVEVSPEEVTETDAGYARYSLLITSYRYNINGLLTIELPEELEDAARIYTINE